MAKKKKANRKSRSIVTGYLEKISSKVFDQYRKQITEMITGNYGVYALYRRNKLYYIGLAIDLRKRINHHLRDHHKGKWTHFSLYIIRKTDHIREVEALLLRIADPTGNYMKGRLKGSRNLRPTLKRIMTEDSRRIIKEILGQADKPVKRTKAKPKAKRKTRKPQSPKTERPLYGLFPKGKVLYCSYKGKEYKAWVCTNARIRVNGQYYDSPSVAGIAVTKKKTINGWKFWKYKDENGELVYIDQLRK